MKCGRMLELRYLSQFGLGLGQRCLFLIQLSLGGVQLHPLGFHHPVDPPIDLEEWGGANGETGAELRSGRYGEMWGRCSTSIARTHMQSDLAASDTLPMMSGWKSDIRQY